MEGTAKNNQYLYITVYFIYASIWVVHENVFQVSEGNLCQKHRCCLTFKTSLRVVLYVIDWKVRYNLKSPKNIHTWVSKHGVTPSTFSNSGDSRPCDGMIHVVIRWPQMDTEANTCSYLSTDILSRRFAETWDVAPNPMGSFKFPPIRIAVLQQKPKALKMVKSLPPGGHGHGGQAEGRYRDQCQTGRAVLGSCTLLVSIEAKLGIQQWFLIFSVLHCFPSHGQVRNSEIINFINGLS